LKSRASYSLLPQRWGCYFDLSAGRIKCSLDMKVPNEVTSPDAAMSSLFHIECQWRGASELSSRTRYEGKGAICCSRGELLSRRVFNLLLSDAAAPARASTCCYCCRPWTSASCDVDVPHRLDSDDPHRWRHLVCLASWRDDADCTSH